MTTTTARYRIVLAALGLVAATLLAPALVLAHAALDVPTPADGATVEGSPEMIEGTFTQDMEADGSSLELRDAAGTSLATGGVDPNDPRRMAIDQVPELAPGDYEVRWTTLSAEDGEIDRDTWTFTVVAAPTPEPTPEPSTTAAPTATPEPSEAASAAPTPVASPGPDDGSTDGTDPILPIVLGLTIVAIAAVVLVSRRGRTSGE